MKDVQRYKSETRKAMSVHVNLRAAGVRLFKYQKRQHGRVKAVRPPTFQTMFGLYEELHPYRFGCKPLTVPSVGGGT